jgi:hypothetical protein
MGYPDGGSLTCTQGIVSNKSAGGTWGTDATAGVGNSGGPLFDPNGSLVGILLQGSAGRDGQGKILLGYFLGIDEIGKELSAPLLVGSFKVLEQAGSVNSAIQPPPLQKITMVYRVDDENVDHSSISPTEKSFERSFAAQDGFRITSASFQSASANHVKDGPRFAIVDNGARIIVRYTLESGPFFDQWRGWLVGSINTTQERRAI